MHQHTAELRKLLLAGRMQKFVKNQMVQSSDDKQSLSLVKTGFVKRYMITSDGTLGVQSIYGPDDIFPLTIVFKVLFDQSIYAGPETYYYETMSDTILYKIDNDTLLHQVRTNPLLYRDLLSISGQRFQSNIQRLENLSLKSSYKRVAHQLVYFAREFGEKKPNGSIEIKMPLTQQDIAHVLSATRETVSVSFAQLRKSKLISGSSKAIVVPDLERLEEEAYS